VRDSEKAVTGLKPSSFDNLVKTVDHPDAKRKVLDNFFSIFNP